MSGHSLYTDAGDLLFHFKGDLARIRVGEEEEEEGVAVSPAS